MSQYNWFKFSPVKWALGGISRESEHIQITFLWLINKYWTESCDLTVQEAIELCGDEEFLRLKNKKIVKVTDNGTIKIDFLDEQLENVESISRIRSEAGKKGGLASKSKSQAKAKQVLSKSLPIAKQNEANGSRREEIEEKEKEKSKKKKSPPSPEEFVAFALEKKPDVDPEVVTLKYQAWIENDWKDGNDKPIKNWKTKLLNTIPHLPKHKDGFSVIQGGKPQKSGWYAG